jgi:5-methylcytosine-specific restriction endonuclease McrBC GTP-binding regulatory subunit McrB
MAKFDGVVDKRLLTVTEKESELTLVFEDNRYLFVSVRDGKLKIDSVPE